MRGLFCTGLLLLFPFLSFASDIQEHKNITSDAVQFFENCFPKKLSQFSREVLIASNVEEDINLVRKWVFYSHYYNPRKDVSTWRGTSLDRVKEAESYLTNWKLNMTDSYTVDDVRRALVEVGHVIHHIQDSTVPAHVVPVKHWLGDKFEGYRDYNAKLEFSCADIQALSAPTKQLQASATETLNSLKQEFAATLNGQPKKLNWDYYWFDTGETFGSYGYFGNNFGVTQIKMKDGVYEISPFVYQKYWTNRRSQSVLRTAQILFWFFHNLMSKGQSRITMDGGSQVHFKDLLFQKY